MLAAAPASARWDGEASAEPVHPTLHSQGKLSPRIISKYMSTWYLARLNPSRSQYRIEGKACAWSGLRHHDRQTLQVF